MIQKMKISNRKQKNLLSVLEKFVLCNVRWKGKCVKKKSGHQIARIYLYSKPPLHLQLKLYVAHIYTVYVNIVSIGGPRLRVLIITTTTAKKEKYL